MSGIYPDIFFDEILSLMYTVNILNKFGMRLFSVLALIILLFVSSSIKAQKHPDKKVYLRAIDKQHEKVVKDLLEYSNAITQRKKADKITALGKRTLEQVNRSELKISAMPAFQNDKEFRDSSISFMKTCFNLLNNEYDKIVSTEPAAEKTYDKMRKLLMAKVAVNQKLKAANLFYSAAAMKFDSTYKDDCSNKIQQEIDVNIYYNNIYLPFFKSYNAEYFLIDAIRKKDGNSVEQNKKIVSQNAQDGLQQIDTVKAFNGDNSLAKSCKSVLTFYSQETDEKIEKISAYFPVAKDFQKTRSEYERKTAHVKDEVATYKKSVAEFNVALSGFNKATHSLDHKRRKALKKWNHAAEAFLDKHLPN